MSARATLARRGVTLIEMLVAMAISLIMMAAVANLFAVVGGSVSASRASITLSEQLRSARNLLQADLAGATASTLPPLRPENGDGYFEYFEGPSVDYTQFNATGGTATYNNASTTQNVNSLTGDADDVLMFTTRSKDWQPFVGKYYSATTNTTVTVESQAAEIAWFTVENGRTIPISTAGGNLVQAQLFTLYRRVLLVAPEYNAAYNMNPSDIELVTANNNVAASFFNEYDLSAHYDSINGGMVLNTMSDLTKRENRYGHDSRTTSFPFPVLLPPSTLALPIAVPATGLQALQPFWTPTSTTSPLNHSAGGSQASRVGEDVVLTNVLSFDVKVYDNRVPLYLASDNRTALVPSDVGYWTSSGGTVVGYGAFVDLGYGWNWNTSAQFSSSAPATPFFGQPALMPGVSHQLWQWNSGGNYTAQVFFPTYDTWSMHYESPGLWNSYTSIGNNGVDDDGLNGVDDPGEYQFPAPYSTPLRGIQVKIRTYEPDSKQIREVTIVQDFVPQ